MSDPRLQRKIDETKAIAAQNGLDLARAPLLASFEMPIWGSGIAAHEVAELSRQPGVEVAVLTADPLPAARREVASVPRLHVVAEGGLVAGLSGGAVVAAYPSSDQELEAFAVALFATVAPAGLALSHRGHVSSGRQEIDFGDVGTGAPATARELLHAVRERGATAAFAGEGCDAIVVDDDPSELEAVRRALALDLPGSRVRASRMPSGRFRFAPDLERRALAPSALHVTAQQVALSCDRFLEVRDAAAFGFVTEPVARWQYGPESGAKRLAEELFGDAPDRVLVHLGLHPFAGAGTLFFAYEGSETLWEAANKGVPCITVRDIVEYGRILEAIRKGE